MIYDRRRKKDIKVIELSTGNTTQPIQFIWNRCVCVRNGMLLVSYIEQRIEITDKTI